MAGDRLLRVAEAAERLSVSRKTIYRMASAGKIQSVPVGTGKKKPAIRITESSVNALIRAGA